MSPLTRRKFIRQSVLAGSAIALGAERMVEASGVQGVSGSDKRLNVVVFTSDDADALSHGCFGNTLPGVTPSIDQVATEGVSFTRAHTTVSTCQGSRLSLMSGNSCEANGMIGHVDPLPEGVTTLALELKKAGYFTAIVGKEPNYHPYEAFQWDRHNIPICMYIDGIRRAPLLYDKDNPSSSRHKEAWVTENGYWPFVFATPDAWHRVTRELIDESSSLGKPFFLHLNTSDPHRPWAGAKGNEWINRHFGTPGLPPLIPFEHKYHSDEVPVTGYLPDLPGVREDLSFYYSALRRADSAVGSVMDALAATKQLDNTIFLYIGDQGASLPCSKQSLYPQGTRIPLIIRWPGVARPGSVIDHTFVSIIDVMPTILEGLGLSAPPDIEGKSFLSLLTDGEGAFRDHLFASYNYARPGVQVFPMRSIVTMNDLYIYNAWSGETRPDGRPNIYDGSIDPLTGLCWRAMKEAAKRDETIAARVSFIRNRAREEYYDLTTDPFCLNNLAGNVGRQARVKELKKELLAHLIHVKDPIQPSFTKNKPIPSEWFTVSRKGTPAFDFQLVALMPPS